MQCGVPLIPVALKKWLPSQAMALEAPLIIYFVHSGMKWRT